MGCRGEACRFSRAPRSQEDSHTEAEEGCRPGSLTLASDGEDQALRTVEGAGDAEHALPREVGALRWYRLGAGDTDTQLEASASCSPRAVVAAVAAAVGVVGQGKAARRQLAVAAHLRGLEGLEDRCLAQEVDRMRRKEACLEAHHRAQPRLERKRSSSRS